MLNKNNIPKSIHFLFNNFNLFCFQYLVIIYALTLKKKNILLHESFYYLILTLMNPYEEENIFKEEKAYFQYYYFKLESFHSDMILSLSQLELLEISNKEESNKYKLKISVTQKGKTLVSTLDSSDFKDIIDRVLILRENVPYKITLFKELKGETNVFNY